MAARTKRSSDVTLTGITPLLLAFSKAVTESFQLGDGTMFGRRVVSAQMMAELHHPAIAVGPGWTSVPLEDLHYALGWFTAEYRV
jgi:hypothetical protein